jgi:uncharacterized membrane protein YfcA
MVTSHDLAIYISIGVVAGVLSGVFGIGGGALIVPALIYLVGFSQHQATGTSLAVMLPPIGLAATVEYYRHGNVDFRAAAVIAATMVAGSWLGAIGANRMSGPYLRLAFGLFIVSLGISLVFGALKRLAWI